MVVSGGDINNIMGGMEKSAGLRLHSHRHKLKQRFEILRRLGQGTYGKVQLATNKETNQEVAIKTIKKSKIETEQDLIRIRREIQIMSSVQHPHIIHIYEVFENREKMVLVMEYAAGGELYDYLSERKILTEEEARRIFRQVASAVYYCHKHKICHRDLKLENILLDVEGNAKIADFGLSNVYDEKCRLNTFCGSPLYASPEIVKGIPYSGPEVDCWSLGVLLYTLVYGAMPFDGSNFRRLVKQITNGEFYEPSSPSTASELIKQMLKVDPEERATIEDICTHWWVNQGYSESCLEIAETLANQTPVRLDLLLSFAPKHINSEHMLIQPEEEDISQKSEGAKMKVPPQFRLPPPPCSVPGPGPPMKSHSLGSISAGSTVGLLQEKGRKEADKRHAEDSSLKERKKKKENAEGSASHRRPEEMGGPSTSGYSGRKPPVHPADSETVEKYKKKKESWSSDESPSTNGSKGERRKTTKRSEGGDEDQKVKSATKEEDSIEREAPEREKTTRKKAFKKGQSSQKTPLPGDAVDEAPKPPSTLKDEPMELVSDEVDLPSAAVKTKEKEEMDQDATPLLERRVYPSGSGRSSLSVTSNDETIKASRSSFPDRTGTVSMVSLEDQAEVQVAKSSTTTLSPERKSPLNHVPSLSKPSTEFPDKESFKPMDSAVCDTGKVLQETAEKIEKVEEAKTSSGSKLSSKAVPNESLSSIESSHASVISTPARSRAGSESSSESRPPRTESGRRNSKVFTKAAMWDSVIIQNQQQEKTPPPSTLEKPKKVPRPSVLNMSDITKKFEEKAVSPPPKGKVISLVKVSDARKAFEAKPDEKVPTPRKQSLVGSSDISVPSSKEGTPCRTSTAHMGQVSKETSKILEGSSKPSPKDQLSTADRKEGDAKTLCANLKTTLSRDEVDSGAKGKPHIEEDSIKDKPSANSSDRVQQEAHTNRKDVSTCPREGKKTSQPETRKEAHRLTGKAEVSPRESVTTSSEDEEALVVSKKEEVVSEEKKPKETVVEVRLDTSESSDSESEAERLLRLLSEKREKLEAVKREKLRKMAEAKEREARLRLAAATTAKEKSPLGSRTPSRAAEVPTAESRAPSSRDQSIANDEVSSGKVSLEDETKKSAEENDKMTTVLKVVSKPVNQGKKDALLQKDIIPTVSGGVRTPVESQGGTSGLPSGDTKLALSRTLAEKSPPQKFTEFKTKESAPVSLTSQVSSSLAKPSFVGLRQVRHSIASPQQPANGESQLQRAKRERIIPIMLEDDDDDEEEEEEEPKTSEGRLPEKMVPLEMQHLPKVIVPATENTPLVEPIKKSRRERIIPISIEGEVTAGQASTVEVKLPSRETSRNEMTPGNRSFSRNRGFLLDHSESFSSAGEEEDEEDGYQILTAESLFSTLLNRVRSLTRKMNVADEARWGRRLTQQGSLDQGTGPHGAPPSGFWSSLYSSPRDSPARKISEALSRSNVGRDEDPLSKLSSALWNRSLSREGGYGDGTFSEPSTPFSTLPRAHALLRRNIHMPPACLIHDPISNLS